MKSFELANYPRAGIYFKKVLKINKGDVAAKMYLTECKKLCVKPSLKPNPKLISVEDTGKNTGPNLGNINRWNLQRYVICGRDALLRVRITNLNSVMSGRAEARPYQSNQELLGSKWF